LQLQKLFYYVLFQNILYPFTSQASEAFACNFALHIPVKLIATSTDNYCRVTCLLLFVVNVTTE